MANIRLIKGRIKSAKNIAQITKAMELVSAAKMRKAQAAALAGKLYADKIYSVVAALSKKTSPENHPLLRQHSVSGKRVILLISSNKGLCGGLNTNLFRFFLGQYTNNAKTEGIAIGKKGAAFMARLGYNLQADFSGASSFVSVVPAVTEMIISAYQNKTIDGVDLVFNEFINVVKQEPKKKTILPLTMESVSDAKPDHAREIAIEPSIDEVFSALLPHYVENQIRDAILQAEASEHSARMVSMRNATDNALSLMDDLTLVYNKARQEKITYEITDMITASMAFSV